VFITSSADLTQSVTEAVESQSSKSDIASKALKKNGAVLLAETHEQALEFANRIAAEHITIDEEDLDKVHSAGSIFVGSYSPQAAGDYASGPNHVLPTGGMARIRGGLGVQDFVKVISVQHLSQEGLGQLASTVVSLAEAEGLKAHAESIRVRYAHA
jgi:histidinol dehydrogenase